MKKNIILAITLLTSIAAFGQVGISTPDPKATLDIVASPTDITKTDGLIPPRLKGAELKAKDSNYTIDQTGAIVYVTEALDEADTTDKTKNIIKAGYYHFDGFVWQKLGHNIYNTDDVFTDDRNAFIQENKFLLFGGPGKVGIGDVDPIAKLNVAGFIQFGSDSDNGVGRTFDDEAGEKYGLTQSTYFPGFGDADSPGTRIYTSGAGIKGHISFGNYSGSTAYTEWARFGDTTGNLGINTISSTSQNNPTEKLDVNGNVRIRILPLNGTVDALFTNPDGSRNAAQNQMFTATKTVVADDNGVLGTLPYVSGPVILAGADGKDATGTASHILKSNNGSQAEAAIAERTFTITKKSLVTFSYSAGLSSIEQYNGGSLTDGVTKQIGARLIFSSVPSGSSYVAGSTIVRSAVPFSTLSSTSGYVNGYFYLNGTETLVLEPGEYKVDLLGYVYASNNDSQGIQAVFNGDSDRFNIIAQPIE
ncbi:hypothetical protein [Chryseobacterium sp. M5A1_1a]